MHVIRSRKQQKSWSQSGHQNIKSWYEHRRKLRIDNQLRDILKLHQFAEPADTPTSTVWPPAWLHKTQILAGDTVYLGHNNTIRSFVLSSLGGTDSEEGKVSITSPIGRTLLGRHPGDHIHLRTLDGDTEYTILKIT